MAKCDATAAFHVGSGGGAMQRGAVHCTLDDDHDCPHKGFAVVAAAGGELVAVEWAQAPRAVRDYARWSREHGAFAKWQREQKS